MNIPICIYNYIVIKEMNIFPWKIASYHVSMRLRLKEITSHSYHTVTLPLLTERLQNCNILCKPYLSRYKTWGNSNLLWIFSGLPNAWLNSNLDSSNVNTGGSSVNQCWKETQQILRSLFSPLCFFRWGYTTAADITVWHHGERSTVASLQLMSF